MVQHKKPLKIDFVLQCIRDDAGGKPILLALDEVVAAFGKGQVDIPKISKIISVIGAGLSKFRWNEFNAVVTTLDTVVVNNEKTLSGRPIVWVMLPRMILGMLMSEKSVLL